MRFPRPNPRTPSIQLAPLIDVLLLLLIFYIVTSTFRTHRGIRIDLPASETAEPAQALEKLVLAVGADGSFSLNGIPMDGERLERELIEMQREMPDSPLELRADEAAAYGRVVAALDAVRRAGIRDLTAFTRPR